MGVAEVLLDLGSGIFPPEMADKHVHRVHKEKFGNKFSVGFVWRC